MMGVLPIRWTLSAIVFSLLWSVGGSSVNAAGEVQDPAVEQADEDQRFVRGLRERFLFHLADHFCDRRMGEREVTEIQRANLLIEKMRTQMARAVQASREDRSGAWAKTQPIADDFLDANPQHPRRALIETQQALALLAEGQLIAAEKRIGLADAQQIDVAMDRLREARRRLEGLESRLEKQLPTSPQKPGADGQLSNEQLHALIANVRFQLAVANLERASLYAVDDQVNRMDALTGVVQWLEGTLRQVAPGHPLAQAAQIRMAEAERLLGDDESARRRLAKLTAEDLALANRDAFWVQVIELALVRRNAQEMESLLLPLERVPRPGPDLAIARLRLTLSLSGVKSASDADALLQRASQLTANIESTYGRYWGQLAERTLIAGSRVGTGDMAGGPPPTSATSLDIVRRVADSAFREQRWDDARTAYRTAVAQAAEQNQWEQAFQMEFQAALAAERLGDLAGASRELLELVERQPESEWASAAHLRATWYIAQLAGNQPEQQVRFRDLLLQHLRRWPGATSSHQARLWLARLQFAEQQYALALENYLQISPTSPQGLDAARDLKLVVPRWLDQLQEQNTASVSEVERISTSLKSEAAPLSELSRSNEFDVYWLQALAPLAARYGTVSAEEMAERAEATLAIENAASAPWFPEQVALIIGFIAQDPQRQGRANELWSEIERNPGAQRSLIELLEQRQQRVADERLRGWQLQVAASLEGLVEGDAAQSYWTRYRAELLLEGHQPQEAAALLKPKLSGGKGSPETRLLYARCLGQVPAAADEALREWRGVANTVADHSELWFEAKHEVARLLLATGQRQEATQLLRYIQAVPPGWADSEWKDRLDDLLQRCLQD